MKLSRTFFVDEILSQNINLYMASFDVDALFTNIALDETIDICIKKLFKTLDTLVKVAHVVNLKLAFTDQLFYNLIVLIK